MCRKVVCFDLDDTLYKEIDFVGSAYGEIASRVGCPELVPQMMEWFHAGDNVFLKLNRFLGLNRPVAEYLAVYREHVPSISLTQGVEDTLNELAQRGIILGLITDGRSITQRNKIRALGLERWFEDKHVVVSEEFGSEKTDDRNFRYFCASYPDASFTYVGDNPKKDFIVPNRLHWNTVMLKDDGRNIHQQGTEAEGCLPRVAIDRMDELLDIIR